jgi:putative ABC transport system permease protein
MSLFRMIFRSLRQRPLGTALTALAVALGVMLTSAIVLLEDQFTENYRNQGSGFPLVVGAKGSPLQLVLNVVYHKDTSPGNIPFRVYRELVLDKSVKLAVPYAVGDSFRGFRVVGTTDAIFSEVFKPLPDVSLRLREGRKFRFDEHLLDVAIDKVETVAGAMGASTRTRTVGTEGEGAEQPCDHDHECVMEAVVGSVVARTLKLEVGQKIEPTHGVEGGKAHEHQHLWDVVGILEPTGTALDRVVFINLDSFFGIPEHQEGGRIPETGEAALSAVIVYPRGGVLKATLMGKLSKRTDLQAASPSEVIRGLLDMVGRVDQYFLIVAMFVIIVGVLSVGVALYNTMNERRREIAILRAIGARRGTIMGQLLGEAAAIAVVGSIAGLLLGRLLVLGARSSIAEVSGFMPDPLRLTPVRQIPWLAGFPLELGLVALVMLVSAVAGLLPALKGYKTDVASNLAPLS